jgi:hypothetical protein
MIGETPTNSFESLSHGELLTEVVDMKLPLELEHRPIEENHRQIVDYTSA